jgi:23S rRNA (uracil1939-C5)-methyltransferase
VTGERGRGGRPGRPGGRRGRAAPRGPVPEETVRIESIAAGGEGVGRLADGRVVFVHRTAPGDLAEVGLVEQKPRWTRGRLLRVLEPSPVRREPPCPFYARCGGCTLEHMEYAAQLEAKRGIVAGALRRIGKVEAEVPPVTPSPEETRYRNRVSFALRRRGRGRVVAGFHAIGAPGEVIDIDGRCLLPEPAIARVWDRLRDAWGPDARMLPSGEELRLTLRATERGAVSLLVEGGFAPGEPGSLIRRVEGLEGIWHRPGSAPPELIAGSPGLPETWGDETLDLSGAAFLQVNRRAASLLEDHVLQLAGAVQGLTVVDAYCGAGLHARRLARAGATVTGLELDRDAVAAARAAATEGASFLEGRVEDLLGPALPADLVILNPPRAGVAAEVVEALLSSIPPRIIYVSCNPATLARDIGRMAGVVEVAGLRAFDLFPQTAHVETVADLRRARARVA